MHGALILALAAMADALLGDPPHWPHLVRYMGRAIDGCLGRIRTWAHTPDQQRKAGVWLWCVIVFGFGLGAWAAQNLADRVWQPLGWAVGAVLAFQCLACGQLCKEALAALQPLREGDLARARHMLSMIVGRDTAGLDQAGVRRAVIETVAENLNDGVVAPLLYMALGGPALAVAYKAVNTLDSMVGYRNEQFLHLGRFSARMDDAAGYIPARLTAVLIVTASPLLGLDWRGAWQCLRADHAKHKSPNSGWPESAAAGALGVRLGGPNRYFGKLVEKPWINQGGRQASPGDADAALRLAWTVDLLAAALCFGLAWLSLGL